MKSLSLIIAGVAFAVATSAAFAADIEDTAVAFVNQRWNGVIDCVVSPPPSLHRTKQPAVLIAAGIAAAQALTPTLTTLSRRGGGGFG